MGASYREPVFKLLDEEFQIDWFFGRPFGNIKELEFSKLKKVTKLDRYEWRALTWQKGVCSLRKNSSYSKFLLLGDLFCLSTWYFLVRNKLSRHPKPVYLWSHGWYGKEGFFKKWLKKTFFNLADKTFLYGNYAKKIAIKQGFDPNKLVVIHNSLNYQEQVALRSDLSKSDIYYNHFSNNYPVIIFIGRLTSVKRIDLLIDAIAKLKAKGKIYNVVLIGDGETRNDLERQAEINNLGSQIWFYGACYDELQNASLIYNADLCVSPGNVGLTAMHTMVFGTPVLTHDLFPMQMPEFEAIKEGKTGTFFRYDDKLSLVQKIEDWFESNKDRREQIRIECYHEIDNYWTPEFQANILSKYLSN